MAKKIAVLTSGGDAPGMNAAIRAVTRLSVNEGWEVIGVNQGFRGLVNGEFTPLDRRAVGGIIQHGGTFLGSARCPEFKEEDGQLQAMRNLEAVGVDALVVIGGNGSQTGANALHKRGFQVVGIASTIDNDLYGSEITIGVDTALNVALEAIDRLKVTASSHRRAFLVEVMGRDCGYLALMAGIAGGAEAIVIPERETAPHEVADILHAAHGRGKSHGIVVIAEGAKYDAAETEQYFKKNREQIGFGVRTIKIGHVQRGGTPGAFDRTLATRLGAGAVRALADGKSGVLTGWVKSEIVYTPLEEIAGRHRPVDPKLIEMAEILAQ